MEDVEVKNFCFRQLRKIRIGGTGVPGAGDVRCSLLCSSNEFGLTFVSCSKGVQVFKTSILYEIDKDDSIGATNVIADGSLLKSTLIPTPSPPIHIALSCDSITLSVCLQENGMLKCYFYDTRNFAVKGASLDSFSSTTLSKASGVQLSCLHWNPQEYPEQLAVSTSDGTLHLLAVINDVRPQQQKLNLHANAVCWSPKGKQLAVGLESGDVLQLSPSKNLEQRKSYSCPDLFSGEPQRVSDLYWISTHVFAVVYTPQSPTDNTPSLVFMFTSKDQPPSYINCEDVYYGGGNKINKFYFTYLSAWGIFISCSSNALETVVHSHDADNNTRWVQWELEDTGRAELPLEGSDETYAAGIALDLTSQQEVQITESLKLPPSPLLLLYSDHGVLCPFTMINKDTAATMKLKEIVKPAKVLPSDPRLVRQPKPAAGAQGSPSVARRSPTTAAASTSIPSATSSSISAPPPHSQPAQLQQHTAPPPPGASGSGFNSTPQKSPFSQPPGGLGKGLTSSPLSSGAGLGQGPPSFGQPPSLGQLSSSLGGQSPAFSQSSSLGQPSPLLSQLNLKLGGQMLGSNTGTPQQLQQQPRQQQSSGGSLLGGTGVPGSGLLPSSFPFSAGSLATAASSPLGVANKPSPQQPPPSSSSSPQQQLQQQQQKKQSPVSLPQSSLSLSQQPSAQPPASGTTIAGLRFAPGYLSQQSASPVTTAPLLGQLSSGSATGVGLMKTVGSTSLMGPPTQLPSVSAPVSALQPSIPPSQAQPPLQHLPVKPLHSSTPLAHPAGLQPHPRPLPPHLLTAATTIAGGVPSPSNAATIQPSPMLSGTSPLAISMTAPKPVGNTLGPVTVPTAGHPRPVAPSTVYQSPPVVGVRPSVPLVQKQPPVYASPPSVGEALGPPRTAHHPPPPPSDDSESLGSQVHLESKFATHIQNEIERYTSDLESLKDDMRDLFGDWESVEGEKVSLKSLGDLEQLTEVREETELVENEMTKSVENFKLFEAQCSQLLEDTLKVYEMQAEAKANLRKKLDPSYAALLKVRPLDTYSSQRLNDIRACFVKTEQSISEVNSQLDGQIEKKYEEKKQAGRRLLKVPSIQMVYSTLRDHRRISRVQNANVDKLTRDMKQLRMIPQSWQPTDATMPRVARTPPTPLSPKTPTDVANGYGDDGAGKGVWSPHGRQKQRQPSGGDVMQTPVIEKMVGSERLSKLRESLSNITQTPVRTLHSAPTYTLKDLQIDASSVPSAPGSGRQSPHSFGDMLNGSETQSFLSEPSAATATPALNQTRVLSHPPQQFVSPSLIPQDSETLHRNSTGSSVAAPGGSSGSYTPQDSALQSLQGSLSSLRSFKPDIVVGGSQREIAVRMGSGFTNLASLAARPVAQQQLLTTERQYSIDAHADPHGQIAVTTKRGSQIQRDLSPRNNAPQLPAAVSVPSFVPVQRSLATEAPIGTTGRSPPQWGSPPFTNAQPKTSTSPAVLVPSFVPVQRSLATEAPVGATGRSPLQWGSPPFTNAQPKTSTSSLASLSPLAPTSISPKRGGTVAWGVPPPLPSTTTAASSEAKPKQTMPPPVSKAQAKPPQAKPTHPPANGGVNLSHSSSAPSLVKPPNKSAPFLGQESVKNGLPQPFPSLNFGGSTNPLCELKRSEPVGDLTQIRTTSTQKGSAAGGGGGVGSGLIGHQPSSASVPNVALTTQSDSPLSFGIKVTSPHSSSLTTTPAVSSAIPPPTFAVGGLPASLKPSSVGDILPPTSASFTPNATTASSSFPKPFATGLASLLSASKPAPVMASTAAPGAGVAASKPVFPFGASPGTAPQFTFSLGSSMAPSFMASLGQGPKSFTTPIVTTTHATSPSSTAAAAATPTGQSSGLSGSLFGSLPKFSLGSVSSGSPFQFSAMSSPASSTAATTTLSSTPTPPFSMSGLGIGSSLKSPFTSQASSPSQSTTGAAPVMTTKPPSLSMLGSSLSTPVLSTSSATSKPFPFAVPGSSSLVFGDKSGGVSLTSMLPKMAVVDPSKLQEKGQKEEKKQEEDSEVSTSSGDGSDASGGEDQSPPPPSELAKPKDGDSKQTSSTAAKPPLPATLPTLQKVPTEGVSKTISPIVKPAAAAAKAPLGEAASKDTGTPGNGAVKTREAKDEENVEKKKPSPPPVWQGSATETKAEEQTTAASMPSPEDGVGVAKVDKDEREKAPLLTTTTSTTAAAPVSAQPSQSTTTTTSTTSDKDKPPPQPTNLTEDSKQAPLPPIASPKVEDSVSIATPSATAKVEESVPTVASKTESIVGKTLAGDEEKEKQSVIEKPAETSTASAARHVSFGGVQQLGQQQLPPQPMKSGTGSQGLSVSLGDLDNEADMEGDGDMEDVSEELSGPSGLFGGSSFKGLGSLGGKPSNTMANPFGGGGGGGGGGIAAAGVKSSPGLGGSGLLKPSALGSSVISVISPPKFGTPSGSGLFSGLQQSSSSTLSSSSTGIASSGFGMAPSFGSGPGLGTGLGGFGSPPQIGNQSAMSGRLFGGMGGSTGSNLSFGSLAGSSGGGGGGGGGDIASFGGLAKQGQQQQQQQQQQQSSSFGSSSSFQQWR